MAKAKAAEPRVLHLIATMEQWRLRCNVMHKYRCQLGDILGPSLSSGQRQEIENQFVKLVPLVRQAKEGMIEAMADLIDNPICPTEFKEIMFNYSDEAVEAIRRLREDEAEIEDGGGIEITDDFSGSGDLLPEGEEPDMDELADDDVFDDDDAMHHAAVKAIATPKPVVDVEAEDDDEDPFMDELPEPDPSPEPEAIEPEADMTAREYDTETAADNDNDYVFDDDAFADE
jgi:hypothetical protein